ncbi:MAG: SDR family oxidoreductase [Pseudomonadota bacterium]
MRPLVDELRGKTALVTGASSGLGRAIAVRLAQAGAKIGALGRRRAALAETSTLISDQGGECFELPIDISKPGEIARAIEQTTTRYGDLDILVNCAGVMYLHGPEPLERSRWEAMLRINLMALIEGCETVVPHMMERRLDGRIVNVTSLSSRLQGGGIYGASKLAAEKYSEELRTRLEESNIRVSTIVPGGFSTNLARDMTADQLAAFQANMGSAVASAEADQEGRTPYFGVPEDVARAVHFAVAQPSNLNISEMIIRPARNIDPDAFVRTKAST